MSIAPLDWKKLVIEHYGSIADFRDTSTVEIIRQQISAQRSGLKDILDTKTTHPGVVDDDYMAKVQAEDDELSGLDAELADWQASAGARAPVAE